MIKPQKEPRHFEERSIVEGNNRGVPSYENINDSASDEFSSDQVVHVGEGLEKRALHFSAGNAIFRFHTSLCLEVI